jgi:hypothetical protein
MSNEELDNIFEGEGRGLVDGNDISFVKEKEVDNLNNYCYFCDFNKTKPHMHHIIRKCDGGTNQKENLIPLCANHHECIHRRIYLLIFNPKQGFYYLKDSETGKIIPPADRQKEKKRKVPLTSIKYSNNLKIKGDLDSKATISIIDFRKPWRNAQRKRLKENNKKISMEVWNESGVESKR